MRKIIIRLTACVLLLAACITANAQGGPGRDNYRFALRTNLLYDGLEYPTLGAEWRINPCWGIKVDGSWSGWDYGEGDVQKMWGVNPEVRFYFSQLRRWYVGLGGNIGSANLNSGPMYWALDKLYGTERGYQGDFYGGGLVLGYQVYFSPSFSLDLNIGGGYTHFKYDAFGIVDGQRVYSGRDLTRETWGLTQAGVTLVWKILK